MNATLEEKYHHALERILQAVNDEDMSQANRLELVGYLAAGVLPGHMPWEVLRPIENPDDPEEILGLEPDDDWAGDNPSPTSEWDPPFTLEWDAHNKMATLRRWDGYTVVVSMGERTYQRIKQAHDDGFSFYALKAMFPRKHSVYNA